MATTFFRRLRGLLGCDPAPGLLLIAPCRAIHTFGMRAAIDVVFIDGHGVVVSAARNVGPGRRLRCREAVAVIERFATSAPFFTEGDALCLGALERMR